MTYRLFVMRPKNIWTLFSKCQVISSCGVAASAGVVGSPFAPNEVPAPVCAAALTESRYYVRSAHEIFKVQLPKRKIPPMQRSDDFVGGFGDKMNRVCCGAVNLSAAFIGCDLLISASEHDQNGPPYQAVANNVNTS